MGDLTRNAFRLYEDIKTGVKDAETYNTGLVGEALIVSAYKKMTIIQLEKLRFIINKIIKKKKELERQRLDAGHLDNEVKKAFREDEKKV